MAHLCITFAGSIDAIPVNYGSSGITPFDSITEPGAGEYCEISIFNNIAKIDNG
jgi:hypothetical protein